MKGRISSVVESSVNAAHSISQPLRKQGATSGGDAGELPAIDSADLTARSVLFSLRESPHLPMVATG